MRHQALDRRATLLRFPLSTPDEQVAEGGFIKMMPPCILEDPKEISAGADLFK